MMTKGGVWGWFTKGLLKDMPHLFKGFSYLYHQIYHQIASYPCISHSTAKVLQILRLWIMYLYYLHYPLDTLTLDSLHQRRPKTPTIWRFLEISNVPLISCLGGGVAVLCICRWRLDLWEEKAVCFCWINVTDLSLALTHRREDETPVWQLGRNVSE